MKPLIDSDVLRYEVGFSGQPPDEYGRPDPLDFDRVAQLLDDKIELICNEVDATEPPTLYISADQFIIDQINRRGKLLGLPPIPLQPNFREKLAVTKKYKGTRKAAKPFHYYNLTAYMLANYDCRIANGIEADDFMCIEQYARWNCHQEESVICSRDKDLRICPGWHYSWECGRQASIGPKYTDELGSLEKRPNGKVLGYGLHFFYYQMLAGDNVDNIQGIRGHGPEKAYKKLTGERKFSEQELYQAVVSVYQEAFNEEWKAHFDEMANLLWMVRELDENGEPVLYKHYGEG